MQTDDSGVLDECSNTSTAPVRVRRAPKYSAVDKTAMPVDGDMSEQREVRRQAFRDKLALKRSMEPDSRLPLPVCGIPECQGCGEECEHCGHDQLVCYVGCLECHYLKHLVGDAGLAIAAISQRKSAAAYGLAMLVRDASLTLNAICDSRQTLSTLQSDVEDAVQDLQSVCTGCHRMRDPMAPGIVAPASAPMPELARLEALKSAVEALKDVAFDGAGQRRGLYEGWLEHFDQSVLLEHADRSEAEQQLQALLVALSVRGERCGVETSANPSSHGREQSAGSTSADSTIGNPTADDLRRLRGDKSDPSDSGLSLQGIAGRTKAVGDDPGSPGQARVKAMRHAAASAIKDGISTEQQNAVYLANMLEGNMLGHRRRLQSPHRGGAKPGGDMAENTGSKRCRPKTLFDYFKRETKLSVVEARFPAVAGESGKQGGNQGLGGMDAADEDKMGLGAGQGGRATSSPSSGPGLDESSEQGDGGKSRAPPIGWQPRD